MLVTNGTYTLTGQVAVANSIAVRSVNGPAVTIVDGNGQATSNRCFSLSGNCMLDGFTVTNGYLTNTFGHGGGVYSAGGSPVVMNCVISGNSIADGNSTGGGIYGCTVSNCTISGNFAAYGGGADASTLNNCILSGNSSHQFGGGANLCTLNNCLLIGNSSQYGGGTRGGMLNNCTVSGNNGQYNGGGCLNSELNNCIVYYNTGPNNVSGGTAQYTCSPDAPAGSGNIASAPLFADTNTLNYRLSAGSPCVDAGTNQAWMTSAYDLDGRPRISGAAVDMGANEFGFLVGFRFSAADITWDATIGRTYQPQWTTNLVAAWSNLGSSVVATSTFMYVYDWIRDHPNRSYRVIDVTP